MRPYDNLLIEHNALLTRDPSVSLATIIPLLSGTWDELYLPGLHRDAFHALATAQLSHAVRVCVDRDVADPYVDLERVRQQGYVSLLGASTRAQLRKAQRGAGELALDVAGDLHDAMDIYDEMVDLHQRSWIARGHPGAFAEPWFDHFHRRLIAQRFAHGEVLLTRLRADGTTLGCLYSFVSHGRALFYQGGLAEHADRHVKPGYLCHASTIEHCASRGLTEYDFLGGDARYKQNLATDESRLVWARVQRLRFRFVLEEHARAWVHARRARATSSGSASATR
jgi:CelD/BcsL family acetyltransferase involved in cellulose biosynthesis